MGFHRLAGLLLVLGVLAAPTIADATCERVVAVGDLHGGYDAFVTILRETDLVDRELRWQDERACLVQLGDVVDRGARSRHILDLLIDLQRQAPDRVSALLGNHEVMNIIGDLRFVDEGEFAAFADEETAEERNAALTAFRRIGLYSALDDRALRVKFDAMFPSGWFAHRRAFSPEGRYGSWMVEHATLTIINDSLYVHGGISSEDAAAGIEKLNRQVRRDLVEHHRQREALIEAGWLGPLTPLNDAIDIVGTRLGQARPADGPTRAAQGFLASVDTVLMRPDGPLWNRDLAWGDESAFADSLSEILANLRVNRIVVAHTTLADHEIRPRFQGRVYAIDTGAGPAYGGRVSALEIERNGPVRAIYPGASEVLWRPAAPAPAELTGPARSR
jgi:hypothetical protein